MFWCKIKIYSDLGCFLFQTSWRHGRKLGRALENRLIYKEYAINVELIWRKLCQNADSSCKKLYFKYFWSTNRKKNIDFERQIDFYLKNRINTESFSFREWWKYPHFRTVVLNRHVNDLKIQFTRQNSMYFQYF